MIFLCYAGIIMVSKLILCPDLLLQWFAFGPKPSSGRSIECWDSIMHWLINLTLEEAVCHNERPSSSLRVRLRSLSSPPPPPPPHSLTWRFNFMASWVWVCPTHLPIAEQIYTLVPCKYFLASPVPPCFYWFKRRVRLCTGWLCFISVLRVLPVVHCNFPLALPINGSWWKLESTLSQLAVNLGRQKP